MDVHESTMAEHVRVALATRRISRECTREHRAPRDLELAFAAHFSALRLPEGTFTCVRSLVLRGR